mmetsp:Transcript_22866/g.40222  ORF Transcript_22866/g.40222 Transcript_22866/m.40222 type:complete len:240 (+) Transcript_22866:67-786(+)
MGILPPPSPAAAPVAHPSSWSTSFSSGFQSKRKQVTRGDGRQLRVNHQIPSWAIEQQQAALQFHHNRHDDKATKRTVWQACSEHGDINNDDDGEYEPTQEEEESLAFPSFPASKRLRTSTNHQYHHLYHHGPMNVPTHGPSLSLQRLGSLPTQGKRSSCLQQQSRPKYQILPGQFDDPEEDKEETDEYQNGHAVAQPIQDRNPWPSTITANDDIGHGDILDHSNDNEDEEDDDDDELVF